MKLKIGLVSILIFGGLVGCAQQPHAPSVGAHTASITVEAGAFVMGSVSIKQEFGVTAPGSTLTTSSTQGQEQQNRPNIPLDITQPLKQIGTDIVSGATKDVLSNQKEVITQPVVADQPIVNTATGNYVGLSNPDRPTWYFPKKMKDYPSEFNLTINNCTTDLKVTNNGTRWEGSGYLVKQSDVPGRGMAVLAPNTCKSEKATISW